MILRTRYPHSITIDFTTRHKDNARTGMTPPGDHWTPSINRDKRPGNNKHLTDRVDLDMGRGRTNGWKDGIIDVPAVPLLDAYLARSPPMWIMAPNIRILQKDHRTEVV